MAQETLPCRHVHVRKTICRVLQAESTEGEDGPQEIGAVRRERGRRHVCLHADRHGHTAALWEARGERVLAPTPAHSTSAHLDVAELLCNCEGIRVVQPKPTEAQRLVDAEEAVLPERLEDGVRGEDALALPIVDVPEGEGRS